MIEPYIRPVYQFIFVDPIAKLCQRSARISANEISVLSALVGLLIPVALYFHHVWFGLGFLLLSGFLDTLDGTVARLREQTSTIGTVLDILADRVVEFSVIFGLYLLDPVQRATLALMMLGSVLICITSFLVVGIFTENDSRKGFYYSPGIIERPEAFAFFVAMLLIPTWYAGLTIAFIILVLLTSAVRVYEFIRSEKVKS